MVNPAKPGSKSSLVSNNMSFKAVMSSIFQENQWFSDNSCQILWIWTLQEEQLSNLEFNQWDVGRSRISVLDLLSQIFDTLKCTFSLNFSFCTGLCYKISLWVFLKIISCLGGCCGKLCSTLATFEVLGRLLILNGTAWWTKECTIAQESVC